MRPTGDERDVRPADLGIARLLWIFAILAVALVGALAVVPVRGVLSEWRGAQERYNARAPKPIEVRIRQIWKPELGVVDRCPSCHVAMDGAAPTAGEPLFAAHPPIPHEPREMGCTPCHAGQGRATTAAAAHGKTKHWDEPLLEPANVEAGCGTCHSHIPVRSPALVERGRRAMAAASCAACHKGAKDLGTIGLRGFAADWHERHKGRTQGTVGFTPLPAEDVAAVTEYLGTLVGAPRLMAGKELAHRLGCRGCHRIGGVGGDDGPDLSDVGRKVAADLDYSGVRGPHSLAAWLGDHFLDPARVVPGSLMPDLGLTAEQAGVLTTYMLSLRSRPVPEAFAPRDRIRAMKLGEREFAVDGASLFGAFCAACHGPGGEGRRYGAINVAFPAIGNAEFLALVDDAFLQGTLVFGRPGRRMPAWGTKDGGLRPAEIDALVAHLRSLQPAPPALEAVLAAPVDLEVGRRTFALECSPCHGASGQGSAVAPPLMAADGEVTRTDLGVYDKLANGTRGTAMGAFRLLDAAATRSLIAAVRTLPQSPGSRKSWTPARGDRRRGADLYARNCAGCHGARGEGREAPGIGLPAFLAAATDGYLTATTVRGRGGTSMPGFGRAGPQHAQLDATEVCDIVAFVRSLQGAATAQNIWRKP
jgi:mono/diheme cytochrome c family protein